MVITTALAALAVYSGGLWTTLLFRQMAAAFWFTILTPAALLMTVGKFLEGSPDKVVNRVLIVVFIVYGIAGFLLARWLFLRAQDVAWTGGNVAMPEMRGLARLKARLGAHRIWRPRMALFIKELQLHQSQLLMAGVLVLLHLGGIAMRKFGGGFSNYPDLKFVLEQFWWLWLVMPLLVGCAAVAEERKTGTFEGQLCLPVKRRTQFAVKLFVVGAFAILLGTIMPWLLEGNRILPDIHFNAAQILADVNHYGNYATTTAGIVRLTLLYILASLSPFVPFFVLALISAGVAALAFYASTQAHSTLEALGPAVLGIIFTWFLLVTAYLPGALFRFQLIHFPLWQGWLIYYIGVPVMVTALATLGVWNFKHVLVGWNMWRRNLLTLVISLALVMTATTALYHRVWELLTPLEPPHGATGLANSTNVRIYGGDIAVFLPDGRVWLNRYWSDQPNLNRAAPGKIFQNSFYGDGRFLDGTNWTDVAECWLDIVGLQRDGGLWVSEKPERQLTEWGVGKKPMPASIELVRFGNDRDWKSIAVNFPGPFLLKTDGTLWKWGKWGTNRVHRFENWAGLRAFEPQRLGTNSDWSEIFVAGQRTFFRTTDGQMWAYPAYSEDDTKLTLGHGIVLGRVQYLDQRSTAIVRLPDRYPFRVGVRQDGTFHLLAQEHWNNRSHSMDWEATDLQIGHETNWVGVASEGGKMVTLKRDGSLWLWTFQPDLRLGWNFERDLHDIQNITPIRLGTHSDWIAVGDMLGGVVSLAADGSLWFWRFEPQYFYRGQATHLLAVSRKPQFLGNVFGKAD